MENCTKVNKTMTTAGEAVMPPARSGHVAVCIGKFMIVWGGYNDKVSLHYPVNFAHVNSFQDIM